MENKLPPERERLQRLEDQSRARAGYIERIKKFLADGGRQEPAPARLEPNAIPKTAL